MKRNMDLLPKDHAEFSTEGYWNEFFSKLKSQSFEWYGEYNSLCDILDKYIRIKDQLLVVGCGNSRLSTDLYDVGILNTISIDINGPVIKQMKERFGKDRPEMRFEKMDVFNMEFESETFGVVIDKGTLDALLVDKLEETNLKINRMFSEIDRVLRYGGRYICISLLQEHVMQKILHYFLEKGWLVRIHRCKKAEASENNSISFPVFVIVITKMKKLANSSMILEIIHDIGSAPKRLSDKQDAVDFVKSIQHYAFLKHYINKKKLVDDDICLELYSSENGATKYKLYIVDQSRSFPTKFAIFVVPQGRETEWLFGTPDGRQELALNAKCERLVVVHLLRNVIYKNLDEVKGDISAKVMELAPSAFKSQVPILSLDDEVGIRDIKCSDKSDISGEYSVEEVCFDNNMYRRLIFLSNPLLVQSEARLIKKPQKKKKKNGAKFEIDFNYLACVHHEIMVAGLTFLKSEMLSPKILQIGLGGGCLAMYLYKHFNDAKIHAVELDSSIVSVAKKWFGLVIDERLSVNIANGISFIKEAKSHYYDAVMLDVDSKDSTRGMSSPPPEFLEEEILNQLLQIIQTCGVVIINLSCRNSTLRNDVISRLKSKFKCVLSKKVPKEVNEVLYCVNYETPDAVITNAQSNAINLKAHLDKEDIAQKTFDVCDLVQSLKEVTL